MTFTKTYIFLITTMFLLTVTSCEKLEMPTEKEKKENVIIPSNPPEEEEDNDEDDTNPPTKEDAITYTEYYGSTEQTAYSIYDVLHVVPIFLEAKGAIGIPHRYVTGYIVGYIPKNKRSLSQTIFSSGDIETNIVLADSPDETDYTNCIAAQLSTSTAGQKKVREGLNLKTHPENLHKQVILNGHVIKYMGVLGLKNVNDAIIYTNE